MTRIKRGQVVRRRHKKVLAATKGFRGLRRTNIRRAKEALMHALSYAYRDRKAKKRDFRGLWITRINSALTEMGLGYSTFMKQAKDKNLGVDRKILAQLATTQPEMFKQLVETVTK
jgi:large subunit ribosomal protein L20